MCDCVVALATVTGSVTVFGKNSDRPIGEAAELEWHPSRRDLEPIRCTHINVDPLAGDTFGALLVRPWWSWGAEMGVNEAGVAIGNEAIYTLLDPRSVAPALTGLDLVRIGLERSATAMEAVEIICALLDSYGQGGACRADGVAYWSSFLIADSLGAYVLETSGRDTAVDTVETVRAISNRTTIPTFDAAHRHPRQPVETHVDPRLAASEAALAARPLGADAVMRHLRSHEGHEGWTICMHADDQETTASLVAELAHAGPRGPSRVWVSLGSPCHSVYVPLRVGEPLGTVPEWERFAGLSRTSPDVRDALDELEVWLAAEQPPNDEAWAAVEAVLTRLGV